MIEKLNETGSQTLQSKNSQKNILYKNQFSRGEQKTEVQRQVNQHLISDNLNRDFLVFSFYRPQL